jgi:hypothetical protein
MWAVVSQTVLSVSTHSSCPLLLLLLLLQLLLTSSMLGTSSYITCYTAQHWNVSHCYTLSTYACVYAILFYYQAPPQTSLTGLIEADLKDRVLLFYCVMYCAAVYRWPCTQGAPLAQDQEALALQAWLTANNRLEICQVKLLTSSHYSS